MHHVASLDRADSARVELLSSTTVALGKSDRQKPEARRGRLDILERVTFVMLGPVAHIGYHTRDGCQLD
jgi:hypothetical protein